MSFVFGVFLVGEYFVDEAFLGAVPHILLDLLPAAFDHEIAVLAPDAVVGLVAETGQLCDLLPGVGVLGCHLQQPFFHLWSPDVLAQSGIHNVAEALTDLQFALDSHFLCNLCPPPHAVVFEQDQQHECFPEGPSSGAHFGVDSVVEFVVYLFEAASLDVLADLLPVVAIQPLLLDYHCLLQVGVGAFGGSNPVQIQPSLVELESVLVARGCCG